MRLFHGVLALGLHATRDTRARGHRLLELIAFTRGCRSFCIRLRLIFFGDLRAFGLQVFEDVLAFHFNALRSVDIECRFHAVF